MSDWLWTVDDLAQEAARRTSLRLRDLVDLALLASAGLLLWGWSALLESLERADP